MCLQQYTLSHCSMLCYFSMSSRCTWNSRTFFIIYFFLVFFCRCIYVSAWCFSMIFHHYFSTHVFNGIHIYKYILRTWINQIQEHKRKKSKTEWRCYNKCYVFCMPFYYYYVGQLKTKILNILLMLLKSLHACVAFKNSHIESNVGKKWRIITNKRIIKFASAYQSKDLWIEKNILFYLTWDFLRSFYIKYFAKQWKKCSSHHPSTFAH